MALTKVSGGILDPGINVAGIVTATGFDGPFTGGSSKNINAGIITATKFVGPFDSVTIGGGTTITSDGVNVTGIVTCTELDLNGNGNISGNLVIDGNLTANGDFTTLNTTLREVEILRVDANTTAVAGIITQRGSGDIFSAYDTSTQVFKIADGGDITFFGGSNSKNASWDYSTNTLSFDGNGSVNNQYAKTQFGSASQGMKLYNNLNNFISVPPIVALFVESADFQIYGSGSRGGTTYDGTIFIAREGVVELGHEVGGGGATGMKLKTVGYGVTILGTTETQKLNVTGISTLTGDVGVGANLSVTGIATVTTRLNINTVSGTRLAVAGTNYPWRGMFMIKDTTTGSGAQPYMTFWDGSEANDGSNTGLLGRAGHVNGGATNERFDFWTYRSTTPLSLGTSGTERLRITPAGQVLVISSPGNAVTARTLFSSYTPSFQIEGNSKSTSAASLTANVNNTVGPSLWFAKTRGTAVYGSNTAVQDDDELGTIVFNGADGTDIQTMGAYIRGVVDGSVSSNNVPGRLQFHTATGGTMYERLRITNNGTVHTAMTGTAPTWLGNTMACREKFSVFQGANFGEACFNIDVDNANSFLSHNMYYDGGWKIKKSGSPVRHLEIGTDGWTFMTGADGSDNTGSALTERFRIDSSGNLTVTGSTANLFTSNSYNILELRADENNDGGNDDCIFKFTHDGTFRSEMRYDESSSTLEISTADNRDDFSMDTDGKVTFAKDIATLQDYPITKPTLDLNFTKTKSLDPRINYVRTGAASYLNEFGKIVTVGENVPRFDYDPTTLEPKGLLIEESRQNMFGATADMGSNAGRWPIGGARGRRGVNVEGPDGKMTALQNIYLGTSGDLNIYYETTTGATEMSTNNSTVYTFSVFVKMKPGNGYINSIRMRAFSPNRSATFYIHSGSLGSINEGSSSISSRSIIEYPNGWYRCIMTFTSGTDGNHGFQIYLANSENASLNSSSANGEAMYFWGAQLEIGSFATSFIPTQSRDGRNRGSQTIRGADILDIDGKDFTDFYNQSEGTILSSHTLLPNVPDAENVYVYQIQDASTNNVIRVIDKNSSYGNLATGLVINGGSSQFHFNNTTDSYTKDKVLVALSVKQDDFAGCHNGGTVETDTSGTLPTNMNSLGIGRYPPSGGYELNGHIQRFTYYPRQLSDSQLKTLTS